VIQQINWAALTETEGNQVTFIPSTCDFSENAGLMEQGFGKRNNCFPLTPLAHSYADKKGNVLFFFIKGPISSKNTYRVTVWTFFDLCGGSNKASRSILRTSYITQPAFKASIYKSLDATKLNEKRFDAANLISESADSTFGQNCWKAFFNEADAFRFDSWSDKGLNDIAKTGINVTNAAKATLYLSYIEISYWFLFSVNKDNQADLTGSPWIRTPKLT
jgi:hypothetical protein